MVFKGCSRCHGDVYTEDDLGGRDVVCLQCGYRVAEGMGSPAGELDDASLIRWLHSERVRAA